MPSPEKDLENFSPALLRESEQRRCEYIAKLENEIIVANAALAALRARLAEHDATIGALRTRLGRFHEEQKESR
jgi:capsule polysaccharide export protein KpsE/RkpR